MTVCRCFGISKITTPSDAKNVIAISPAHLEDLESAILAVDNVHARCTSAKDNATSVRTVSTNLNRTMYSDALNVTVMSVVP